MALDGALLALGTAHYQRQQAIVARTTAVAEQAWVQGSGAWRGAVNVLADLVLAAQVLAASDAQDYVATALELQGVDPGLEGDVNPEAFGGIIESPLSLYDTLVAGPLSVWSRSLAAGLAAQEAQRRAQLTVVTMVSTAVADAGRSAESVATVSAHRSAGFVRMLVPPSCPRCVVLAGRVYRSATAFRRHKRCDCRHIPAAEGVGGDLTLNPKRYFRSLPSAEQDATFGKAGAQAIRDGADMSQVVNARQGMSTVNAYGRDVLRTLEGTTKRGLAGQRLAAEGFTKTTGLKSARYAHARTPRLMPEEIYRLADELGWDRTELLRQLKRFAYIL